MRSYYVFGDNFSNERIVDIVSNLAISQIQTPSLIYSEVVRFILVYRLGKNKSTCCFLWQCLYLWCYLPLLCVLSFTRVALQYFNSIFAIT